MTTCVLYSPLSSSLYPFLFSPQVSSSTRKARSSIGSNEPFSHSDQPLPDPISPWTYFAIVTAGPFIPRPPPPSTIHTLHPHLPTPFTLFLASPASIQPCSRSTCVYHGDKAKRKRERERESVRTVCNLCCCSLFLSSFGLPLLSLHRPWQGGSHSDLFGLRKTGSQQTSFFFLQRTERWKDEWRDRGMNSRE